MKFAEKVMFLHVSVCQMHRGEYLGKGTDHLGIIHPTPPLGRYTPWGRYPLKQVQAGTPPGRYTSYVWQVHPLGKVHPRTHLWYSSLCRYNLHWKAGRSTHTPSKADTPPGQVQPPGQVHTPVYVKAGQVHAPATDAKMLAQHHTVNKREWVRIPNWNAFLFRILKLEKCLFRWNNVKFELKALV